MALDEAEGTAAGLTEVDGMGSLVAVFVVLRIGGGFAAEQ